MVREMQRAMESTFSARHAWLTSYSSSLPQSKEGGFILDHYFRGISVHQGGGIMAAGMSWSHCGGLPGSKELRAESETGIAIKDQLW